MSDGECCLKHYVEQEEEEREAEVFVGQQTVYDVCRLVSVRLVAHGESCLFQCSVDKSVFGVHDSRFAVFLHLLFYPYRLLVSQLYNLFAVWQRLHEVLGMGVHFEELDGEIASGIFISNLFVGLQEEFHSVDSFLDVLAVVDMDMAVGIVFAFVYVDDGAEEVVYSLAGAEHRRHHRYAEETAQGLVVEFVAVFLKLVKHVQCTDDTLVHVYELGGKIQVSLDVARVDNVDYDIRGLVDNLPSDV